MGWFGPTRQMLFYLSTVNADRDPEGNYLVGGAPPTVGLGGDEVAIPDETYYLVNGQRKALAAGLCSTSYGTKVKVF